MVKQWKAVEGDDGCELECRSTGGSLGEAIEDSLSESRCTEGGEVLST